MKKNFEKYFLGEIDRLRDLSKDFIKLHPSVANLLSTPSSDPDVERLLEGVAYLNSFVKRDLDNLYPQIAEFLIDLIYPHYLKQIPSLSILKLTPKSVLKEKLSIRKGINFLSRVVEDMNCNYQNVWDIDIYPLESKIYSEDNKLTFEINSDEEIKRLPFFINSSYSKSLKLFRYFHQHLKEVNIYSENKNNSKTKLDFIGLKRGVFSEHNDFNPYSILQEYFIFIEKFFLFEIELNQNECKVEFIFDRNLDIKIDEDDIKFFCVPIINIFETDTDPIEVDFKKECINLNNYTSYKIYSVEKLIGFRNSQKIEYHKFNGYEKYDNSYEIFRKKSFNDNKVENCLLLHLKDTKVSKEILSIKIKATNGESSDNLGIGDIYKASDNSPELVEFKNITKVTKEIAPPPSDEFLWKFVSHLNINITGIKSVNDFKEILKHYIYEYGKDKAVIYKNLQKIEGILKFETKFINKLYKGQMIQGLEVNLVITQENFSNIDDVYLFGLVIQYFLSTYVTINNFISLNITEKMSGEVIRCKTIVGNKELI